MDMTTAIKAARQAGFTAVEKTFFADNPTLQRRGVLLGPGQAVLTPEAFVQFVQDGCKNPAKYQIGEGFRSVLSKNISERIAELYEAQKPFVEPISADDAGRDSKNIEDLERYAKLKEEIALLEKEQTRIEEWFDSLGHG